MPPVNQPRTLCSLVADALCEYIYMMVSKGTDLTESTDDVLQGAEEELEKLIMHEKNNRRLPEPFMRNTYKAALHLKNVQTMLEKHGSVPNILSKNLSGLPASFLNELINKMLVSVSKIIVYDEDQIEKFLNDQWSIGPRLKVGLHVILKSMLSVKISSLDFSPISNPFCKVLARYFMKAEHKNNRSINDIEKKKDELFTATIFSYKEYIVNVTSLSLQNLASARLVWAICYCCPNLWHLDISGNLFDMDRYCALERAPKKPSDSRNRAEDRWFDKYCAEFIQALSGIYGSHGYHTNSFEEVPHSLRKLRTLYLPDVEWTDAESFMLNDHGSLILQYCVDLQEITGVNLYFIFMNFGGVETLPLIMKLRKFYGKDYKGGSLSVPRDVFRKVRLPCITEVNIVMTLSVGPWILKEFPNMKHLKVTPLFDDIGTYNCSKILPYLTNLCFLDITFKQEISLSEMCEIADCCKHLQSFKLKCPGLLVDGVSVNGDSGSYLASKNEKGQSDFLKKDVFTGSQKSHQVQWSLPEYIQSWLKTSPAPYEQDNKQIPKFSKLHTLEISEVRNTDVVAMYKCIKGSPNLRTFSFVALEGGDDRIMGINDDFVGRVSPLFKCLKELTLGAEDKKGCKVSLLKNLTGAAVEHIVNLCMNIQAIGNVACWNISSREVKSMNKRFKKCNYILRLR